MFALVTVSTQPAPKMSAQDTHKQESGILENSGTPENIRVYATMKGEMAVTGQGGIASLEC